MWQSLDWAPVQVCAGAQSSLTARAAARPCARAPWPPSGTVSAVPRSSSACALEKGKGVTAATFPLLVENALCETLKPK